MDTSKIDIIYFTLFPWDNAYSSVSLSLARELGRHNRVFYVNHPHSVKDFLQQFKTPAVQNRLGTLLGQKMVYETIPGVPESVVGIHPPLTMPINWMKEGELYDAFYRWNSRRVLRTIRRIIRDHQLQDFIYLNCFNPYYCPVLPGDTGVRLNIYQCIDDMSQEAYTARHGYRLEMDVIRKANIALVTSSRLHELKSPLNPQTYVLNNAVDINIFQRARSEKLERPQDLRNIHTPIIGFTGNLDGNRINYDLLRRIALAHPDKTLVLVGPLNNDDYRQVRLDNLPNVLLTGAKPIQELPAFLQHMDCTIIPFLCNELTSSIYPLKINEYLAAGKSVVSTNFSKDIQSFSPYIRLAPDEETFIQMIDPAIADNAEARQQEREACARNNTWTARVARFWEIVAENW